MLRLHRLGRSLAKATGSLRLLPLGVAIASAGTAAHLLLATLFPPQPPSPAIPAGDQAAVATLPSRLAAPAPVLLANATLVPRLEPAAGPTSAPPTGSPAPPAERTTTPPPESARLPQAGDPSTSSDAGAKRQTADPSHLADAVAEVQAEKLRLERARAELELRERAVAELIHQADEKLRQLEDLAGRIGSMLDQVEKDEEARLQALVALYQAMKPKQAAQIFDQLELPILLRLARRMRDSKLAPIVAAMDPRRAQELTAALSKPAEVPSLP